MKFTEQTKGGLTMKEISCRAQRKDNGEWTEGYVFELQPGQYMICDRKQHDRPSTLPVWEFFRYCSHEVIPETICQYTGLTDKNGKRIWENDILKCGTNLRVSWHTQKASWVLSKKGWLYNHFFGESVEPEDVEVVGNIFDNPELLKKQ